eukprot:gene3717-4285_t
MNRYTTTVLLIVSLLTCLNAQPEWNSIVDINDGPLEGLTYDTHRSFYGIPFAQPPVGNLRWASPLENQPWAPDTFNATYGRPGCPQQCGMPAGTCPAEQSEDCLTLDVFTPAAASPVATGYPVMLFIPGGRFEMGAAYVPLYDGGVFCNRSEVILVNINYRFGALGFLVANNDIVGNYGVEDQLMAMQWVQDNIKAFGGDPTQVTVFGESAGGTSAAIHLVSPASTGLFSKIIIESNPWSLPIKTAAQLTDLAGKFAKDLGCKIADTACFRSKSIDEIIVAQNVSENAFNVLHPMLTFLPWTPVIDDHLIPDQPLALIQLGAFNKVPVLLGTVRDEALIFIASVSTNINKLEWNGALIDFFGISAPSLIKQTYASYINSSTNYFELLSLLGTDYIFVCPTRAAAQSLAVNGGQPVWQYQFQHVSSFNAYIGQFPECQDMVCHGLELPYVFDTVTSTNQFTFTPQELQLSLDLMQYWTNFAKTGNPNTGSAPSPSLEWPAFDKSSDQSLIFQTPSFTTVGLRKSYCDFWDTRGYQNVTTTAADDGTRDTTENSDQRLRTQIAHMDRALASSACIPTSNYATLTPANRANIILLVRTLLQIDTITPQENSLADYWLDRLRSTVPADKEPADIAILRIESLVKRQKYTEARRAALDAVNARPDDISLAVAYVGILVAMRAYDDILTLVADPGPLVSSARTPQLWAALYDGLTRLWDSGPKSAFERSCIKNATFADALADAGFARFHVARVEALDHLVRLLLVVLDLPSLAAAKADVERLQSHIVKLEATLSTYHSHNPDAPTMADAPLRIGLLKTRYFYYAGIIQDFQMFNHNYDVRQGYPFVNYLEALQIASSDERQNIVMRQTYAEIARQLIFTLRHINHKNYFVQHLRENNEASGDGHYFATCFAMREGASVQDVAHLERHMIADIERNDLALLTTNPGDVARFVVFGLWHIKRASANYPFLIKWIDTLFSHFFKRANETTKTPGVAMAYVTVFIANMVFEADDILKASLASSSSDMRVFVDQHALIPSVSSPPLTIKIWRSLLHYAKPTINNNNTTSTGTGTTTTSSGDSDVARLKAIVTTPTATTTTTSPPANRADIFSMSVLLDVLRGMTMSGEGLNIESMHRIAQALPDLLLAAQVTSAVDIPQLQILYYTLSLQSTKHTKVILDTINFELASLHRDKHALKTALTHLLKVDTPQGHLEAIKVIREIINSNLKNPSFTRDVFISLVQRMKFTLNKCENYSHSELERQKIDYSPYVSQIEEFTEDIGRFERQFGIDDDLMMSKLETAHQSIPLPSPIKTPIKTPAPTARPGFGARSIYDNSVPMTPLRGKPSAQILASGPSSPFSTSSSSSFSSSSTSSSPSEYDDNNKFKQSFRERKALRRDLQETLKKEMESLQKPVATPVATAPLVTDTKPSTIAPSAAAPLFGSVSSSTTSPSSAQSTALFGGSSMFGQSTTFGSPQPITTGDAQKTTTTTATSPTTTTVSTDNWKCQCCDTINTEALCSCCMVPKPKNLPKTSQPAPSPTSSVLFGGMPATTGTSTTTFPTSTSSTTFPTFGATSTLSFGQPATTSISPSTGGFSFNASAKPTNLLQTDAAPSNTWKCACCETNNENTLANCSICMVPKPKPKTTQAAPAQEKSATSTPAPMFGGVSVASTPSNTSFPSSFGGSNMFSQPATSTGGSSLFGQQPSTTIPSSGGFSFNAAAKPTNLLQADATPSDSWKCACCETNNENTLATCSVCMVPKPKPKTTPAQENPATTTTTAPMFGGVSAATTTPSNISFPSSIGGSSLFGQPATSTTAVSSTGGFSFNASAKPTNLLQTDAAPSNTWKCACCETNNENTLANCSICMVPKPKPKTTQAAPAQEQQAATSTPAPMFGGVLAATTTPSNTSFPSSFGGSNLFSQPATSTGGNSLFGQPSTTIQSTGGFSFNAAAKPTNLLQADATPSDSWKCACCETNNENTLATCSVCMVPKPKPKATESANPSTLFGNSNAVSIPTAAPAISLFGNTKVEAAPTSSLFGNLSLATPSSTDTKKSLFSGGTSSLLPSKSIEETLEDEDEEDQDRYDDDEEDEIVEESDEEEEELETQREQQPARAKQTFTFGSVGQSSNDLPNPQFGSVNGAPSFFGSQVPSSVSSIFGGGAGGSTSSTTPNSVFGSTVSVFGGAPSVFSTGSTPTQASNSGVSVFGSKPSVFGTSTTSTTSPTSSVFGGATTAPPSVFGSSSATSPTAPTSVFGTNNMSVFGGASTAPTSVFGSLPASVTAPAAPVFGSTSTSPAAPVFGSTPSVFGSSTAPASVFGSTSSVFGASTAPTSVFGSPPATTTAPAAPVFGATSTSGFGSPPATATAPAAPVFGSTSTSPAAPVFGSTPSVFGTSTTPSSAIGSSSTSSVPVATQTSDFGSPPSTTTPAAPVFGATSTTSPVAPVFGASSAASIFGSTTTTPAPIFGATSAASIAAPIFGGTSLFGSTPSISIGQQQAPTVPSLFGTSPPAQASLFGELPTSTAIPSLFGALPKKTLSPPVEEDNGRPSSPRPTKAKRSLDSDSPTSPTTPFVPAKLSPPTTSTATTTTSQESPLSSLNSSLLNQVVIGKPDTPAAAPLFGKRTKDQDSDSDSDVEPAPAPTSAPTEIMFQSSFSYAPPPKTTSTPAATDSKPSLWSQNSGASWIQSAHQSPAIQPVFSSPFGGVSSPQFGVTGSSMTFGATSTAPAIPATVQSTSSPSITIPSGGYVFGAAIKKQETKATEEKEDTTKKVDQVKATEEAKDQEIVQESADKQEATQPQEAASEKAEEKDQEMEKEAQEKVEEKVQDLDIAAKKADEKDLDTQETTQAANDDMTQETMDKPVDLESKYDNVIRIDDINDENVEEIAEIIAEVIHDNQEHHHQTENIEKDQESARDIPEEKADDKDQDVQENDSNDETVNDDIVQESTEKDQKLDLEKVDQEISEEKVEEIAQEVNEKAEKKEIEEKVDHMSITEDAQEEKEEQEKIEDAKEKAQEIEDIANDKTQKDQEKPAAQDHVQDIQVIEGKANEKADEMIVEISQEINEKAEEMAQEIVQHIEETTQAVNDDTTSQEKPHDTVQHTDETAKAIDEKSEEKAQEIVQDIVGNIDDTTEVKAQEIIKELKQKDTQEDIQEKAEEKDQEMVEKKDQEAVQEIPEEKVEEIAQEKPEEKVDEIANTTEEKDQEVVQEIPEEKDQEIAQEKPEENVEEIAQEKPEEKDQETTDKPVDLESKYDNVIRIDDINDENVEEIAEIIAEVIHDNQEHHHQTENIEKDQESARDIPEEKADEKDQDVQEIQKEKVDNTTEEKDQEAAQEIPEEKHQEAVQEIQEEKVDNTTEEKDQEAPKEIPEEKHQEAVQEIPEERVEEIAQEKPEEKVEEVANTTEEKDQEAVQEIPEEIPQEKPEGKVEEIANTTEEKDQAAQEIPEEIPQEKPEETVNETIQDQDYIDSHFLENVQEIVQEVEEKGDEKTFAIVKEISQEIGQKADDKAEEVVQDVQKITEPTEENAREINLEIDIKAQEIFQEVSQEFGDKIEEKSEEKAEEIVQEIEEKEETTSTTTAAQEDQSNETVEGPLDLSIQSFDNALDKESSQQIKEEDVQTDESDQDEEPEQSNSSTPAEIVFKSSFNFTPTKTDQTTTTTWSQTTGGPTWIETAEKSPAPSFNSNFNNNNNNTFGSPRFGETFTSPRFGVAAALHVPNDSPSRSFTSPPSAHIFGSPTTTTTTTPTKSTKSSMTRSTSVEDIDTEDEKSPPSDKEGGATPEPQQPAPGMFEGCSVKFDPSLFAASNTGANQQQSSSDLQQLDSNIQTNLLEATTFLHPPPFGTGDALGVITQQFHHSAHPNDDSFDTEEEVTEDSALGSLGKTLQKNMDDNSDNDDDSDDDGYEPPYQEPADSKPIVFAQSSFSFTPTASAGPSTTKPSIWSANNGGSWVDSPQAAGPSPALFGVSTTDSQSNTFGASFGSPSTFAFGSTQSVAPTTFGAPSTTGEPEQKLVVPSGFVFGQSTTTNKPAATQDE